MAGALAALAGRYIRSFTDRIAGYTYKATAVCHGAQVLMAAGVLAGKACAAYPAVGPDVTRAGGTYVDLPVDQAHVDGTLVTGAGVAGGSRVARPIPARVGHENRTLAGGRRRAGGVLWADADMQIPTPLVRRSPSTVSCFAEGCFITAWWNAPADDAVSVARARVEPGMTTRWHRLRGMTERYLILEGRGRVEVGELPAEDVGPGAVVLIPPGTRQRIAKPGDADLLFLAIRILRFTPAIDEALGSDCGPRGLPRAQARIATHREDPAHEPHGTD